MQAVFAFSGAPGAAGGWMPRSVPERAGLVRELGSRAELDDLRRQHRGTLQALAEATKRAEEAERRLRSRLLQLTWPAALGGIAGGFAAVILLRLAGL